MNTDKVEAPSPLSADATARDTAPLSTPDCNLRGLKWMPLDVVTLPDSEFFIHATGEEFKAGMILLCISWSQVPAGSLPNNEAFLADASRTHRRWTKVRRVAMSDWVLCSDGRYYHPVIAEKAMAAFARLQRFQYKVDRRLELESQEWAMLRSAVFLRDNFTCTYCGARGARLEPDHVVPVASGGQSTLDNLVTACRPCNRSKGAKSLADWRVA